MHSLTDLMIDYNFFFYIILSMKVYIEKKFSLNFDCFRKKNGDYQDLF